MATADVSKVLTASNATEYYRWAGQKAFLPQRSSSGTTLKSPQCCNWPSEVTSVLYWANTAVTWLSVTDEDPRGRNLCITVWSIISVTTWFSHQVSSTVVLPCLEDHNRSNVLCDGERDCLLPPPELLRAKNKFSALSSPFQRMLL